MEEESDDALRGKNQLPIIPPPVSFRSFPEGAPRFLYGVRKSIPPRNRDLNEAVPAGRRSLSLAFPSPPRVSSLLRVCLSPPRAWDGLWKIDSAGWSLKKGIPR